MGITIHYNGTLDDPRVLPDLLAAARHFCFQRKWKYLDVDDRIIGTVERTVIDKEDAKTHTTYYATTKAPIDDTLRGVIIQPHPESEAVWLTFNQQGELCFYHAQTQPGHYWEQAGGFTKTQFAPLDVHISICELLALIRDKYFPTLRVVDEGEYWETRDPARLAERFKTLNALMDQVGNALSAPDHPLTQDLQSVLDEERPDATKRDPRKKKGLRFERGAKIKLTAPLWKRGHGRSAGKN